MKLNKRTPIALLLVSVLLLSLCTSALAAEEQTDAEFETIYIESAADLLALADQCSLNTWSVGKLVILQADISLEDTDFLPIPTFGGVFNGNGHTISGLHITENMTPAGLFGEVQLTGVIQDLTVSGTVMPNGDGQFVGGIVGENYGTISNCSFTGKVVGSANVGGIVGINGLTGKIANCTANGTVIGSDMTGGIAGCNLGYVGSCINQAYINTVSYDPAIHPEDISFDFMTDLSKLNSLDVSTSSMDTGGIAGYSSGILESCNNKVSVGYPHVGYNVGGIAGRSCGYIYGCENTADIYGRKDVGGIIGQMEPYIAQNLTESTLNKLERQLDELDVLLDAATQNAEGASDSITRRLNSIAGSMGSAGSAAEDIRTTGTISGNVNGNGESGAQGGVTVTPAEGNSGASVNIGNGSGSIQIGGSVSGGVAGEGGASGSGSVNAQTQINISTSMAGLASSLYGMAGQMSMLSGELGGASDELLADVELIRAKINEITETGFELVMGDGEEDVIIDSSELNIDLITLGKAAYCTNSGAVNGDLNVGGITGVMGMEYALDPEDDITVSIDGSTKSKYEVKAVIQHCKHSGNVTAKRDYVGGIAGKMDLGLIAQCESYGIISSESGNYAGGIAGIGGSTIRHCFTKCSLSGSKYIGGIVGSGVEEDTNGESSTVAACYAIVTITDSKQYIGAISGAYAGTFLENFFVSEELAGINRMSYTGCAEPVSYDTLIARFSEETAASTMELPEEFKKFNLQFVVDDAVIRSEIFDYGASFGAEVFPEIPEKDGYYGYWDRTQLQELKFDTTVTAVYEPYISALESSDKRNGDKPIFFVEGNFGDEDLLTANAMALQSGAFDLTGSIGDAVVTGLTAKKLNTEVVEQWQLQIPDDGQATHSVRYLPPDGDADRMDVYVLTDGTWSKVDTEVIGSYVTFLVYGSDVKIAAVSTVQTPWAPVIAVLAVLILLILLFRLLRRMIKPKRRGKHEAPIEESVPSSEKTPKDGSKPKSRLWLTIIAMLLALLVGIGGTVLYFQMPALTAGIDAYELLKAYAEKESLSMTLRTDCSVGEQHFSITAELDRTTLDGKRVTAISESGRTLYYSDSAVFLENGTAYKIGGAFPDYSHLLNLTMALYETVEIEAQNDVYSITAANENAKAITEMLIPSAAGLLSATDALQVNLITDEGVLKRIELIGSGKLNDEAQTAYSVYMALEILDSVRTPELPEAVAEAITTGEYEATEVLSEDLYQLAKGWEELNGRDPLGAELALRADCGPIVLNKTVQLNRWLTEDEPIYGIHENGYALYFTDGEICDSSGNSIPTASAGNADAAQLLDIIYAACMNGSVDCTVNGTQSVYTLSLNEEGMKAVAYAVVPEAEKLNISFESGRIQVVMEDHIIKSMEVYVNGSVQIVLATAEVSIGAALQFADGRVEAEIPNEVKEALEN